MRTEKEIRDKLVFTRMAKQINEERQEIIDRYGIEIDILTWVLNDSSKQKENIDLGKPNHNKDCKYYLSCAITDCPCELLTV